MATPSFHVSGGQIIGPNGQPFKAQGIDILESTLPQVVGDANGGALLQNFPDTNYVRLVMESGYNDLSDPALLNAIDWLTAKGIVVEISNCNQWPTVSTGSQLTQELAWYTQLATMFKNNPYVWLGTDNEPEDVYSGLPAGTVTAEHTAVYNAIRATGNTNMINLEAIDSRTASGLVPSAYASMTNVLWGEHYYNWMSNNSADLATNENQLTSNLADVQSIHSGDGVIPVMVEEFGNATDGNNIDPGGTQVVQAVTDVAPQYSGWSAWGYYWPGATTMGDELLNQFTGQLTPYGQQIQSAMVASDAPSAPSSGGSGGGTNGGSTGGSTGGSSAGSGGSTVPASNYITPGSGSFTDAAGNVYTIDAAGNADENGQPITGGAGTGAMEYANGTIYGQDANTKQWYTWNQSNWAASAAPPAVSTTAVPVSVATGSGSDTLVLSISEDAYANGDGTSDAAGDARFTVSVDGKQLAGTFTAQASHAAGADQTFTFYGNWAPGTHSVGVDFLNDAYAGTPSTDRNLYVDGVKYDGANTGQSAALMGPGTYNFTVTDSTAIPPPVVGSGSDKLVVDVSEDYYLGNAQFTVAVDGKQLGGTFTATTLHSSGGSQAFGFAGDFGTGQHTVKVTFLNDAYAGSPSLDRNLYINDIIYTGTDTGDSHAQKSNGSSSFTVTGGTAPSVSETSDHGSLQKTLSQTGTYTVGGDTFVLGSGNAVTTTLGSGTSQIAFIGPSSLKLTGGSGNATITADTGTNTFTAGSGSLDVRGGGGSDTYVFHASSGLLTIEDFSVAKGDKLVIDSAMKASMVQGTDGEGGTLITFGAGASAHAIDVHGLAAMPSTSIGWA